MEHQQVREEGTLLARGAGGSEGIGSYHYGLLQGSNLKHASDVVCEVTFHSLRGDIIFVLSKVMQLFVALEFLDDDQLAVLTFTPFAMLVEVRPTS